MTGYEIKIIDINLLKPHEEIISCHLTMLMKQIKSDGFISSPIAVDRQTMVILDGHHRYNILKIMKMKICPVCLVDYNDDEITVGCWRDDEKITKKEVIAAGLSGKLLAPKTSKHKIPNRPQDLNIPLSALHKLINAPEVDIK